MRGICISRSRRPAAQKVQSRDLESFATSAHEPGFLSLPSGASDDPLAPCALLAAAATSQVFNMLFYAIINPGKLNIFRRPVPISWALHDAAIRTQQGRDSTGRSPAQRRTYWRACWFIPLVGRDQHAQHPGFPTEPGRVPQDPQRPPELEKRLSDCVRRSRCRRTARRSTPISARPSAKKATDFWHNCARPIFSSAHRRR